jgi:hypothetical protein
MNDVKIFKIEQLHFRIDSSDILPQLEIESEKSMFHIKPTMKEVEKLYNFLGDFLEIYSESEKKKGESNVIILPYSGEK